MEIWEKEIIIKKFLKSVEKTDTCWIWTAGSRGYGYGAFKFGNKTVDSHRVSYILFKGEIPSGIFVCHTCDNPKCVNPDHLWLGTHSDNMKDAYNKGRLNIPTTSRFKKGHKAVNRKLTDEQVKEIKHILKTATKLSLNDIAELFNVKRTVISDIKRGKAYFNVE